MKHYAALKESLPDLSGKVFAITGTTSGTGFIAARTIAEKGGRVLLLNRPSERSKASLEKLLLAVPDADFTAIDCDLQDFDSVRTAAKTIEESVEALYCLSNNAGIMGQPNEATKDGYDVQMQTNHLSHFLLARELFPLLARGSEQHGEARVVSHSSGARNMVPGTYLREEYLGKSGPHLGDDAVHMTSFSGGALVCYQHTKLANTVFAAALAQKIASSPSPAVRKIRAVAAHPGVAMTGIGEHLQGGMMMKMMTPVIRFFANTIEDATTGLLYGMAGLEAKNGVLYGPKNDGFSGKAVPTDLQPHETDQASADMLWKASEEATGVKFEV